MTSTSPDLDALLPTDEDVASYREHGWWLSGKVIPDELLDAVVEGSERFYRGELDDGPHVLDWCLPKVPPPPGLRKNDYASMRCRELGALVRLPVIGAIAARLCGTRSVRLWHDQLLYKPPSDPSPGGNVGWHTDRSYWRACSSEEMLTAWVPFHDITLEHGPLTVIDGSNRWGREDEGTPDFFRKDLDVQEEEIRQATGRRLTKVPVLMERGQVSFHHCRTFHGSGPNVTNEPRRSIAVHMQPEDNRASGERTPDGELVRHANNDLCRLADDGLPDYSDPRYCPVLHP